MNGKRDEQRQMSRQKVRNPQTERGRDEWRDIYMNGQRDEDRER